MRIKIYGTDVAGKNGRMTILSISHFEELFNDLTWDAQPEVHLPLLK